jgi:hypothetical protein
MIDTSNSPNRYSIFAIIFIPTLTISGNLYKMFEPSLNRAKTARPQIALRP